MYMTKEQKGFVSSLRTTAKKIIDDDIELLKRLAKH